MEWQTNAGCLESMMLHHGTKQNIAPQGICNCAGRLQAACVPGLAWDATLHGDDMPAGHSVPPAMLDLLGL